MKIVHVTNGTVVEIIPDYALPPEKWYGAAFAADCHEAPDEVEQGWRYDESTDTFAPPKEPEPSPEPEPTLKDRVDALETTKADKDEVQAVWDTMAAAYSEGVASA